MIQTLRNISLGMAVLLISGCGTTKKVTASEVEIKSEVMVNKTTDIEKETSKLKVVTLPKYVETFLPCPPDSMTNTPEGKILIGQGSMKYEYDKIKGGYNIINREDSIINYYENKIAIIENSLESKEITQETIKKDTYITKIDKSWKTWIKTNLYLLAAILFFILWVTSLLGFNPFKVSKKIITGL